MAAVAVTGSRPEDVAPKTTQSLGPPKAMLVPMRELPKHATIDQEFTVPSELSNCILVAGAKCCIGRRPSGTSLTCIVPEKWIAMSSCHGIIRWEDGKIIFKDTSSNGTFRSKDHTTQESFTRLPKGEPKPLEIGEYIMFSQWSNNRTNDELLIYQVQAIPENLIIAYSKRSLPPVKNVNLKSKTPKAAAKPEPAPLIKCTAGTMAPCKHCAQQASDAITARQELAAEQHKTSALSKELESVKRKADVTALEVSDLREQVAGHERLQEQLSKTKAELELSRMEKDREAAAFKKRDEDHQIQLASMQDAADTAEAEKAALSEQLTAAQTELKNVADQVQRARVQATEKEADLHAEISKLKQQNQVLTEEQEERDITEVAKLKAEHEAEVSRLQKIQLRLEKEAAAWRLKTETVSRTLPDALEKSMIPQLHKAARQCIHRLLQDVNALNDTTASDLFGGTPTNVDKLPGNERADFVGHLGPSQHTVCFSSPGNLAGLAADVPQTEMFEGATGVQGGNAGPSQEEQGPSVSLRHGFALSQAHTALNKDDAVQGSKEPASPLLHGFMRSVKEPSNAAPAQNDDGEAADDGVAGMTTDETHVSDQRLEVDAGVLGRKRKLSDACAADNEEPNANGFVKASKEEPQNTNHDEHVKGAVSADHGSVEDRSTSALAERLKAIKNHETMTCSGIEQLEMA